MPDPDRPTSSSRTRPAKSPLSRQTIVQATLALIDESGLAAVSMRKIAARLDTAAASLYVYVEDRKDLLESAYDLALAEVDTSGSSLGAWSDELERLVTDQITALSAHEDLAVIGLTEAQVGPNSLRITERTLALLRSGGIPDASCIAAADLLDQYAASTAIERASWARSARAAARSPGTSTGITLTRSAAERIEAAYSVLPTQEFPAITALRGSLADTNPDARHRWKLSAILSGIRGGATRRGEPAAST